MKIASWIIALTVAACLASAASVEDHEFLILDGQVIKHPVQDGMPLPAEKSGIKMEVAGLHFQDGHVNFTFGATTKKRLRQVVIEDVTDESSIVLVDDRTPTLKKHYWIGNGRSARISREETPWIFQRGSSIRVFRCSFHLEGKTATIVLHQPAVYTSKMKQLVRDVEK